MMKKKKKTLFILQGYKLTHKSHEIAFKAGRILEVG